MRRLSLVALVLTFSGAQSAFAVRPDGFRCPDSDKLIELGYSTYDVRSRCRDPDATQTRTQYAPNGEAITIDEYTYDFGPHYLVRKLRFENDRLVRIFEGRYGTARPAD